MLESVPGRLRGHLADDWEDASFDAGDQVADVCVGAVDHVFRFDCAARREGLKAILAGADFGHGRVRFEGEVCAELRAQMGEEPGDELVGPHGTGDTGHRPGSIVYAEFLRGKKKKA